MILITVQDAVSLDTKFGLMVHRCVLGKNAFKIFSILGVLSNLPAAMIPLDETQTYVNALYVGSSKTDTERTSSKIIQWRVFRGKSMLV